MGVCGEREIPLSSVDVYEHVYVGVDVGTTRVLARDALQFNCCDWLTAFKVATPPPVHYSRDSWVMLTLAPHLSPLATYATTSC